LIKEDHFIACTTKMFEIDPEAKAPGCAAHLTQLLEADANDLDRPDNAVQRRF